MSGMEKGDGAIKTPAEAAPKAEAPVPFEGIDSKQAAQSTLRNDLLDKNIMPAMSEKDVPAQAAKAAEAMAGKNLGFPSDNNMSSATAVSRLLNASGMDIQLTPNIENLKKQLEDKGFKSVDITHGEKPKAGDLIFTSMERPGRNVGIVGEDGKIYSHSYNQKAFVGKADWNSKFTTVMRPGDS